MQTTWVWSQESEANRILQTAKNIGNGFYTLNNFQIAKDDESNYLPNSVIFPQLPYQDIPNFWTKVRDIDIESLPIKDPHNLTQNLLAFLHKYQKPDILSLQTIWKKNSKVIVKSIARELPTIQIPSYLVIYTTHFGTVGSFGNYADDEQIITLFLRRDANIYTLVECLISALLRPIHDKQNLSWRESEAIIDHLLLFSPLSQTLAKISPESSIGTLPHLNTKPTIHTTTFLNLVGAPSQNHNLSIKENQVWNNNQQIHALTKREETILKTLITLNGKTLTYDNLADLIFLSDDEYSLAVMGKTIERLRAKLEQNGISSSIIRTDRGQGYFLKN